MQTLNTQKKRIKQIIAMGLFGLMTIMLLIPSMQFAVNDSDQSNKTPHTAALNTLLFLSGANQTHTLRGRNFTYSGWVLWLDPLHPELGFQNASNIPVYPIIGGVHYNGLDGLNRTIRTGAQGVFSFSVRVPLNFSVSQPFNVTANVTQIPSEGIYVGVQTIQSSPILHDVTTVTRIAEIDTINTKSIMTNDTYSITYHLTDNIGNNLATSNLTMYLNENFTTPFVGYTGTLSTNAAGLGIVGITQQVGFYSFGIRFRGMGYTVTNGDIYYQYAPCYNTTNIDIVKSVNVTFSLMNAVDGNTSLAYTREGLTIQGTVYANNRSTNTLGNRAIEIFISNNVTLRKSLVNLTTSSQGTFTYIITGNNTSYVIKNNFTIEVFLKGADPSVPIQDLIAGATFTIPVVDEPIPIAPPIPVPPPQWWKLAIVGVVLAGVVTGLFIFQRHRMERQRELRIKGIDLEKFAAINLLYNQNRRREAIAYTYKIYTDLINEKYGLIREKTQTLREFAIVCVTKYGMDPLRTYPYTSLVENVIYGAYDLDDRAFEKAMNTFSRIYEEITGTLLNFALEIMTTSQSTEGVTLKIGQI